LPYYRSRGGYFRKLLEIATKWAIITKCKPHVGREYTNGIHFFPIFHRCIRNNKRNRLLLLILPSREPFLLRSRPNLGSFTSYTCISDNQNHFYLVLLEDKNPFFYCLDQNFVHSLVDQIPSGVSIHVGREYTHVLHFCPMIYTCFSDNQNHFYLVLLEEDNPLLLLLSRPNFCSFTSWPDTNWHLHTRRKRVHACYTLLSYVPYMYERQVEW
jgi:hypothetical protein